MEIVQNKLGKVEKIIMDDGFTITNEYDKDGNLIRVSSSGDDETIYHRDENGDITSVTINGLTINTKCSIN